MVAVVVYMLVVAADYVVQYLLVFLVLFVFAVVVVAVVAVVADDHY